MAPRLLFAVTLTGGHTVPALAVAEAVCQRYSDAEIRFAGVAQGVEARLVPRSGYCLETIPVIGLSRHLHLDLLQFPWMLVKGMVRSLHILSTYRPHAVICTGGYVSGPIGMAAWLLGIPLVLHEQNNFPGITVRVLSRVAVQVYLAFEGAARRLGGRERLVVGNPVRSGWTRVERAEARRRCGLTLDRPTLLVVGGSQGAAGINQAVARALPALVEREIQVLWQTGKPGYETAVSEARAFRGHVVVKDFIDDMEAAYSAADVALTRAGAMTVAELTHLGVPAVLVPLPTASEHHQDYNALATAQAGAARMVRQSDLNAARLASTVVELMDDEAALAQMRARSRRLAVPDAAERIVAGMARVGLLRRE